MPSAEKSTDNAKKPSLFADIIGGIADMAAPIWRGWWDKAYYRALPRQTSVAVFSFLVVFTSLAWFLRVPIFRSALAEGARAQVSSVYAAIVIEDNRLKAPGDQPIIWRDPQTHMAVGIVAPNDNYTEEDFKTARIVAKSDRLLLRLPNGEFDERPYTEISAGKKMPLFSQQTLSEIAQKQDAMLDRRVSEFYVNFVFVDLIARVVEALVLGCLLWIFLKNAGSKQRYPVCIRLAIVAMAPGLLVNFITDIVGLTPLSYGFVSYFSWAQLPFWVFTLAYLCFAAHVMRTLPRNPEPSRLSV